MNGQKLNISKLHEEAVSLLKVLHFIAAELKKNFLFPPSSFSDPLLAVNFEALRECFAIFVGCGAGALLLAFTKNEKGSGAHFNKHSACKYVDELKSFLLSTKIESEEK